MSQSTPQLPSPQPAYRVPVMRVWGVSFYTGKPGEPARRALMARFVVVPSGPGLGHDLFADPEYARALRAADLALIDSGFFTLLWWLRTGTWLPRLSGLRFLEDLIQHEATWLSRGAFWVFPSKEDAWAAARHLQRQGVMLDLGRQSYVAPVYCAGPIHDAKLLALVQELCPSLIIICLGGGVQERLGYSLMQALESRPGILCTGAAIAFLSGKQVRIPAWADRLFLGWLFRLSHRPQSYAQRYLRALKLCARVLQAELPRECE